MRKILALVLPLVFFSLITIQAMAVVTPVKVERVKDVCFIKVKGNYHTRSFLFHYDNLSPFKQTVYAEFEPESGLGFTIWVIVPEGGSIDVTLTGDYGMTMNFRIEIDGEKVLEDAVIIPPLRQNY